MSVSFGEVANFCCFKFLTNRWREKIGRRLRQGQSNFREIYGDLLKCHSRRIPRFIIHGRDNKLRILPPQRWSHRIPKYLFAVQINVKFVPNVYRRCWRFFPPISNSTPLNENTLLGWIGLYGLNVIISTVYACSNIPMTSFFLAIGLFFEACTNHFRNMFAEMGEIRCENSANHKLEMKRALVEAVEFHINLKRYSILSNSLFPKYFFLSIPAFSKLHAL